MQSSEAVGFLGKPAKDLYGRHVGVVVGLSLKTNGDVESMGMDQGNGSFSEIKSNRLFLHDNGLIVAPLWKADVARITGEISVLRKRIAALDDLKNHQDEGSLSTGQYEQLRGQYEARVAKIQESSDKLTQEINGRMEELNQQDETLARFLVSVNIQFRSGEITEESFHSIIDYCGTMKTRNGKEREELMMVYGLLAPQGKEDEEDRQPRTQIPLAGIIRE
jgi:hypothetical protein